MESPEDATDDGLLDDLDESTALAAGMLLVGASDRDDESDEQGTYGSPARSGDWLLHIALAVLVLFVAFVVTR
jgi:hypothetical protein